MGFERKRLEESRIQVVFGGLGGATYHLNGRVHCLAPLKAEGKGHQYCYNEAGLKTDHVGTGRCAFHGGAALDKNIKTGRYAVVAKNRLREHFQDYLNDPSLLDVTPELALQRTILRDLWEKYQNEDAHDAEDIRLIRQIVSDVIATVDKIEKIQSQHVLTASAAKLMMARAVEVAKRLHAEWFVDPLIVEERTNKFIEVWRKEVEP